ncbi:2284_t:CDS:2, partial [Funneliformis caledonium]
VTDKLTPIHDRIFACRSGSAADTQAIADIVRLYSEMYSVNFGEDPTIRTAAALFHDICYQNKNALSAGIIVAGWDKYEGGSVYCIPLGGSLHKQPFATAGSGSTYVYGYCDKNFRENMTQQEAVDFVKNGIALSISRDGSSGGCIRIATVTEAGVDKIFIPGDQIPTFWNKS